MIQQGADDVLYGQWWTSVFPGSAIVLLVLGITLIGESLNDKRSNDIVDRFLAELEAPDAAAAKAKA